MSIVHPAGWIVALAAMGALAQGPPAPPAAPAKAEVACADCGVIRSVKRVETQPGITAEDRRNTAGWVASIPLDGGKPLMGSSSEVRRELRPPLVTYEIVVKMDGGQFRVVLQEDPGDMREGDKVRMERGKVVLRDR
jgi:hypothetical protein